MCRVRVRVRLLGRDRVCARFSWNYLKHRIGVGLELGLDFWVGIGFGSGLQGYENIGYV